MVRWRAAGGGVMSCSQICRAGHLAPDEEKLDSGISQQVEEEDSATSVFISK